MAAHESDYSMHQTEWNFGQNMDIKVAANYIKTTVYLIHFIQPGNKRKGHFNEYEFQWLQCPDGILYDSELSNLPVLMVRTQFRAHKFLQEISGVTLTANQVGSKPKHGRSECPESQSDEAAPNWTAWTSLAAAGRARGGRGGKKILRSRRIDLQTDGIRTLKQRHMRSVASPIMSWRVHGCGVDKPRCIGRRSHFKRRWAQWNVTAEGAAEITKRRGRDGKDGGRIEIHAPDVVEQKALCILQSPMNPHEYDSGQVCREGIEETVGKIGMRIAGERRAAAGRGELNIATNCQATTERKEMQDGLGKEVYRGNHGSGVDGIRRQRGLVCTSAAGPLKACARAGVGCEAREECRARSTGRFKWRDIIGGATRRGGAKLGGTAERRDGEERDLVGCPMKCLGAPMGMSVANISFACFSEIRSAEMTS
ncbi:hypothetical protein B0H13DRAFT_1870385 [Mycena leptocephala]|nr:hypothetical protein B0H13DRAFT_1870385 [Mycena leptocephala]